MKRSYRLLAAVTIGSLLSLAAPGAVSAAPDVEVTATDVTVKYSGCGATRVRVTGKWHNRYANEIHVVVRTPGNRVFDEMTVRNDQDGLVSTQVQLCDRDRPGVYRVMATAIGYDVHGAVVSRATKWTSFKYTLIPKMSSKIRHRVIYKPSRPRFKYIVPGQLLREGRGLKGQRVLLLAWIINGWYKIDAGRTGRHGNFGWEFKPNNFHWRYFYWGTLSTKAAVGGEFRTPDRGSYARSTKATPRQLRALVTRS